MFPRAVSVEASQNLWSGLKKSLTLPLCFPVHASSWSDGLEGRKDPSLCTPCLGSWELDKVLRSGSEVQSSGSELHGVGVSHPWIYNLVVLSTGGSDLPARALASRTREQNSCLRFGFPMPTCILHSSRGRRAELFG